MNATDIPKPVFISYAHKDNEDRDPKKRWLDRLLEHLQPLVEQNDLTVCSDRDIGIGDDWHAHIQTHLNGAKAAVLLVSRSFLASEYIRNNELPILLKNAKDKGVKVLPVIVGPCLFKETKFKYPDPGLGPDEFTLASLQASNPPEKSLIEMDEGEQERVLVKVAQRLLEIVQQNPRQVTEQPVISIPVPGPKQPPVSFVPSTSVPKPPSLLDIIWAFIPGTAEVQASGRYPGFTGFKLGDGLKSDQEYHEENETWPEDAPAIEIAPFWLAVYPVTFAQFRPFVEGDGYKNPRYWTDDGWNWRKKYNRRAPSSWGTPEWDVYHHPVFGVTWYEAIAYCRWMTRRITESRQSVWVVRLPTVAEWEWAARGPGARRWPWGDKWEAEHCNTKESGIGRTSAVGSFPQGANWTRDFPESGQGQAVYDLAGNVWEWCSTRWQKNYPLPVLKSEWTKDYLAGDALHFMHEMRGGSWGRDRSWARAAFRGRCYPDLSENLLGFRCCVATSF